MADNRTRVRNTGQEYSPDSFGITPKDPSLGKGSIKVIGTTLYDGEKFPTRRAVSVNVKTGYPGNQRP